MKALILPLRAFWDSVKKIRAEIGLIVLYDLIFYGILYFIGSYFVTIVQRKSNGINLTDNYQMLNLIGAQQTLSSLQGFFFMLIFVAILYMILIIIMSTIFKGLIWGITLKKKASKQLLVRYGLFNSVWIPAFIIVLFGIMLLMKPAMAGFFVLLFLSASLHFVMVGSILLFMNGKILIKKTAAISFGRIHYFVLPYGFIAGLWIVLSYLHSISGIALPSIFPYILTLFFIAWARYYISEIVHHIH